jgi:hypothetical protein
MSRRRNMSVSPKVIWARRIKWLAIVLAFALLAATAFLLMQYKPPKSDMPLPTPVPIQKPAVTGSAAASAAAATSAAASAAPK